MVFVSNDCYNCLGLPPHEILHYYISDVGLREIHLKNRNNTDFLSARFLISDGSTLWTNISNCIQFEFLTHDINTVDRTGMISVPTSIFLERSSTYLNIYCDLLQDLNSFESARVFADGKILY